MTTAAAALLIVAGAYVAAYVASWAVVAVLDRLGLVWRPRP